MARAAVSTQLARDQTARQLQRSSLGGSPPDAAGPLRIGAAADDTFESLKQLGVPLILCRIPGSWPAWGIHRPSGLFIATFFDADNRQLVNAAQQELITNTGSPQRRQVAAGPRAASSTTSIVDAASTP
jgi:hypothetical protein